MPGVPGLGQRVSRQLACGFVEDLRVPVDVGLGRVGRHQGHVVERRQQDATVERVEVDQPVEQRVAAGRGLAARARALGPEEVLDAST